MNAIQLSRHLALGFVGLLAAACSSAQAPKPPIDRLDREMGSILLGAVPQRPPGLLVEDGEGACARLPYSACAYQSGKFVYYFFDGRLVSKSYEFSNSAMLGPWRLERGDTKLDVTTKLRPYLGSKEPVAIDDVLFYALECQPNLCRLDMHFIGGTIENVRLYYSDAI